MSQITVKGNAYDCGKLDAVSQLHVVRRLGPMLVVAGISIEMLRSGLRSTLDDIVAVAGPAMDIMSKMSDDDVNYILFTCLSVVKRKQGDGWAPVTLKDERALMFNDIDMPAMIRLVIEVMRENIGNFLMEQAGEPT